MATKEGNLVETLRQLIDAEVNGHLEVELPELVTAIQTHFNTRPRLRQLLVTEALPALVVRITHQVMHERRVITEVAVDPRERAAAIFESVGNGQYRSLLALKRPDCVYIDERRTAQIDGHARIRGLVRAFAKALPDDDTTVGDFYHDRPVELEALLGKYLPTPTRKRRT